MQEIQIINRTINIPPELKENIVVEGDSNSQILTFSINRYFDGVDLTTKTIQVAYQNALGQSQYSDAYLKAIDAENDTFTFDWTLPSGIAIKDGEVQISVEFSETVNGVKTYIWKTKPATFYVEDSFPVFGNAQSPDYTLAKNFVDNNNNLGVSQLNDTDEPILIEGREILVPSLIDVVVEGDNKSQIISFKMDRYFKNVDRSTKVISVAYTNALGQSERSPIYNAVVTEDYIIFGWVIDGKVAAKEGIVNFYIECQGNTDEGFYCWKTKPAQLMISKGLKVTGSIPDPTPSWYQIAEQNIKEDLETAKSYAEQAEESANEANNIKDEVIQLKESIETAEPERQAAEQERREYINSLRPYLDTFIETIGIGVEYGLEVTPTSPPSGFVNVSAGAARLSNGQRFVITSTSLNLIAGSDAVNDRKAIIYLDSSGNVATLLGDVDGSVPATPAGGLLLYEVDVRDGTYPIVASMLTDKRKPTIGLYSPVKNKSFESVGARMNEIEEDAQVLESRVEQTENEINILQNRATAAEASIDQHDTELDALKVYAAKLESELAALRTAQAQMSTDTRIDLPGTGKTTLVPKNAAMMGVGGTIKGMTLSNIAPNSDFSQGTAGWSGAPHTTVSILNGKLNMAYVSAIHARFTLSLKAGRTYYFMLSDVETDMSEFYVYNGTTTELIMFTKVGSKAHLKYTPTTDMTSIVIGRTVYTDGTYLRFSSIVVVDMTAYGLESKTAAEMALICPNYISGTQSVTPMRLISTGKNLIKFPYSDTTKTTNGITFTVLPDGSISANGTATATAFFNIVNANSNFILPAGTYTLSGCPSGGSGATYNIVASLDGTNVIATDNGSGGTFTLSKPETFNIIFIKINSGVTATNLLFKPQIESGSSKTAWEPYNVKSACYIEPKPLRRLPNGVCDTVDLATGKRTINIKEYELQTSDITGISTNPANLDVVYINKPLDYVYYNKGNPINGSVIFEVAVGDKVYSDAASTIGYICSIGPTGFVYCVAKGTYANVAAARAALVGKKMWYQLATPITENNVVSGSLISYPKGLIICEPVIADAGIYNNGVTILRTAYPIQSLETLCKVNADGTQTPLDTSAAVIAPDGLSFTHPGLAKGDIWALIYLTSTAGIIGENVYNYVNANGLTLGANGKYYKVGFAIDINGNITLTKTEVV